jgi:DNA-binding response OmpR family regulator
VLVAQVLLAGKDWQTRALLRAQLIEEGVRVDAYETIDEAIAELKRRLLLPALLIVDISASDHPSADVEHLTIWAKRLPTWIIASHASTIKGGLESRNFELVLFRPLDLGNLVEQIKQRVRPGQVGRKQ